MSREALGGLDPYDLDWTIEIEAFSQFSYSIMRNNVFSLCVDTQYDLHRKYLVRMEEPKLP